MLEGSHKDNLAKVIMEASTVCGGLPINQIAQKLICFGANGVNVFQSTKYGALKYIHDTYAFILLVYCMAHYINLVVQTLLGLILVMHIDSLLQCLYFYFAHSPKKHLEFNKISKVMATKGNKNFRNVKTRWILMLKPC